MTRTSLHSFEPAAASPITGATVDLEVSDIEDASIREVLQTPGAAYGAWSILDALLAPTGVGTPFMRARLAPQSGRPARPGDAARTPSTIASKVAAGTE
ncbi:hypothetical protein [Pseudaminobacter soli (ex Li et al. 2025)]|uniref:hypothetical protein n=1 Tax=Pseudaminobacter soli (ex Li et al. 2025) TaxID=1295366 RepID=UPI001FDEDB59|nr:hypothetical protein [Mesorhizobium soli]